MHRYITGLCRAVCLLGLSLLVSKALLAADKIVRLQHSGETRWAIEQDSKYHLLKQPPYASVLKSRSLTEKKDANLVAPVISSKVLAVGLNYRSHAGDAGADKPEIFWKTTNLSTGGVMRAPKGATNLHFEGELVVVIGRECKRIGLDKAYECIFGYTLGNDLTERSWQASDLQWWRAKGSDGFSQIAPWVITDIDASNLVLTTRLNGRVVQQESTSMMIHSVPKIVSYISQYITLHPGDLIYTGTPGRTQAIKDGDVVEVEIEKLGSFSTHFKFE